MDALPTQRVSEGDVTLMRTNRARKTAVAVATLAVFGVIAWAQTQSAEPPTPVVSASGAGLSAPAANPNAPDFGTPFKVDVNNLVAPVLVTDRDHNIIDGLQPNQFHLYDNGVEQNIHVSEAYEPVSLVVAIEKSSRVDGILPQLHKLGILLSQITGKQGEAAVMAFDCKLDVRQDFTGDNDKIINAINNIKSGCSGTRVIDAVERGVYMLSKRPKDNRKIILLVSETRDEGSEARLKEVMINVALSNVTIYPVDISQYSVRYNEKPDQPYPRADVDVANQNLPMGIPSTPTTMDQYYGLSNRAQFVPLLKEIFVETKGIFIKDPATQFAHATGGHQFTFARQKGLEEAVQRISQEVHSQYLVSYAPSNIAEGGYHTITVQIDREPTYICTTRLGYWIGGGAQ